MFAVITILIITNLLTAGILLKRYLLRDIGLLESCDPAVRTAAHEAGHAVVALQSPSVNSVTEISILQTPATYKQGIAGTTSILFNSTSPLYLWERAIVSMGGAAGEMYYCGTMRSGGCKKDLLEALEFAREICSKTSVSVTKREFPFDIAGCYSRRPTATESYVLNVAYAEARKRVHNKSQHLKSIALDLLRAGRLQGREIPRI